MAAFGKRLTWPERMGDGPIFRSRKKMIESSKHRRGKGGEEERKWVTLQKRQYILYEADSCPAWPMEHEKGKRGKGHGVATENTFMGTITFWDAAEKAKKGVRQSGEGGALGEKRVRNSGVSRFCSPNQGAHWGSTV